MIIPFVRGLKKYQWLCMINKSVNTMILWSPNDHQILGQIPSPIPSSQISANGGKDDQKNEAFEPHTALGQGGCPSQGSDTEGTGDVLVFPQVVLCLETSMWYYVLSLFDLCWLIPKYTKNQEEKKCCLDFPGAIISAAQVTWPPETDATKVQTEYQFVEGTFVQ